MIATRHAEEISKAAKLFELDPYLVAALVATESSYDERALRYEPEFKYFCTPEKFAKDWRVTLATETQLQKFSYGPLQIMGATAREQGFTGFMLDLCRVDVGLYWGCKYFAMLLSRHVDRDKAIVSYNAGSPRKDSSGVFVNQVYLDKVMRHYGEVLNANGNTANKAP
jgi:soluble lytic murein transglycosylase-like protein